MATYISLQIILKQQEILTRRFVIKYKQERYLTFLANDKTRRKFTNESHHFTNFYWDLFREIAGNEIRETIVTKVKSKKIL